MDANIKFIADLEYPDSHFNVFLILTFVSITLIFDG